MKDPALEKLVTEVNAKNAAERSIRCSVPDAGPEPPPLHCCGARPFLFGHAHFYQGRLTIDEDLTIHSYTPPTEHHGRWGPYVHRNDCPIIEKEREMLNSPEPPPKPNEGTPVWELVVEDMKQRDRDGRIKYGTPLQTFNGRKPLVDLYQELLDSVVYIRQKIEEEHNRPPIFQKIAGSAPCGCSYDDIGSTLLVCYPHSQDMEKFAKEILGIGEGQGAKEVLGALPPIENGVLRAEILILKILKRDGPLHPSKLLHAVRIKWFASHPERPLVETDIMEAIWRMREKRYVTFDSEGRVARLFAVDAETKEGS